MSKSYFSLVSFCLGDNYFSKILVKDTYAEYPQTEKVDLIKITDNHVISFLKFPEYLRIQNIHRIGLKTVYKVTYEIKDEDNEHEKVSFLISQIMDSTPYFNFF